MLLQKSKIISAVIIIITVLFISAFFILFMSMSTDKGPLDSTKVFNINIPEGAALTVSEIRVKGFTLFWDNKNLGGSTEYAVAASFDGKIDDYKTALENDKIVLDFTSGKTLGGLYKVTHLTPGKNYEIKLFARKKNTLPANYLSANAALPYLDDAELLNVYLDGEPMDYDKTEDSFTKAIIPDKTPVQAYSVTYKLPISCVIYIDEEKYTKSEIIIKDGETVYLTVVNERLEAARDYEISVKPVDNKIPVIYINTENNKKIKSEDEYISAEIKITDSESNPTKSYRNKLYSGKIDIRIRGDSLSPKLSYNLQTSKKIEILDMAESDDWLLWSSYNDKSLIRSYIAYELFRDMGAAFSPKLRFVDLILNGEYMGTYCIGERVKIDEGRLDLPKIKTEEAYIVKRKGTLVIPPTSGDDLNGSYVLELSSTSSYSKSDIIFETKRLSWVTGNCFMIKQPGEKNMSSEAYEYISDYINQVENAIFSENFKDPKEGYRKYINTATFIDWYIVNEIFKNPNADFTTKVYFYKPRGEKLCMGPVWDFDLSADNFIDLADSENIYSGNFKGWHVRNSVWFARLFEDEAFALEFNKRWNQIKDKYLDNIFDRINTTAKLLDKSQSMNFQKWQVLSAASSQRRTYKEEINYLKEWLSARIDWIDKEINR